MSTRSSARTIGAILGSPVLLFGGLVWLIVLLVIGTVSQGWMGLEQAQELYFSSWAVWVGPLPTPGGRLTMAVLSLNLLAHLADPASWRLRRTGMLVTHIGTLCLLLGGLLTALFSQEGSMTLAEGESADYFVDNRDRELALVDRSPADHDLVTTFGEALLRPGTTLAAEGVPPGLRVKAWFDNAEAVPGPAGSFTVRGLPAAAERNRPGLVLAVAAEGASDREVAVLADLVAPVPLELGGRHYEMSLRQRRRPLPFRLELVDFVREVHPGTMTPRSFHSDVILVEGDARRKVRIEMNKPLRSKGYTFYQSSFIQGNGPEVSVLSVVKNAGRSFPYIASLVVCLGLLVHLAVRLPSWLGARSGGAP